MESWPFFVIFYFAALVARDRSKLFWLNQSIIIEAIVLVETEAPAPEKLAISTHGFTYVLYYDFPNSLMNASSLEACITL
ncbi:hypothetical protein PMIT1313_01899 [Prochlorococcus marinus str. MIT 1313]|uniref:hypothetical protein n=1 Tax=Prochlorococcus TaxID=1218 RepID=UPI0007B356AA|nr:hypothetical protein [Prochlorococcus marinus]KZR68286.1 hypothetical protein PMIT1313_01899 [Prochlorococcus marinus str. MIT 1313]